MVDPSPARRPNLRRRAKSCRFAKGGDRAGIISRFFVTNSNPTVTKRLPTGDVFIVLDIMKQFIEDL